MRDVIITSSILILSILLIRHLAKGRIHPLLQYSLWLLVVFKLLIPIPLWNSHVSVLNLFSNSLDKEDALTEEELFSLDEIKNLDIRNILDIQSMHETMLYNADIMPDTDSLSGESDTDSFSGKSEPGSSFGVDFLLDNARDASSDGTTSALYSMKSNPYLLVFLTFIWLIGIMVTGGHMIFYQIKWQHYLRINRKPLNASLSEIVSALGIPLSVYIVNGLPSPCLCGRSIYMTEDMAEDEKQFEHILVHEYCHYRQMDSLWVIVRCILTVIYWFNPLVWAAAYVSKQDSEFACDAAVIRMLGENERIPYGKTLVNLISGNSFGRSKMGVASMMSDGDKGIRERIFKIAGKPKYIAAAAAFVILIAAVLIAVTFSGEYKENTSGHETEDATDIISAENEENIENLINTKEDEDNIENFLYTEEDDMNAKSEQLDEAMQQAVKEHEAAIFEELDKIREMESALQEEMSAIKQADAEAEQAKLEAEQQRLEAQNSEELAEMEAQNAVESAEMEAQNAAESAKMEAAKQALQAEIEAEENESDLSKPLKSEDIQQLLSQAEYTELLPHQSAMHIRYINPCPSYTRISDAFGKRVHPITNIELFHNGVDLAAEQDADIVAASWGIVCKTGYDPTNGNYVVIYHRDENFTYYACCKEILVSEGDRVESGQKIATVGSTGRSTGYHLHFMVSDNGEYVEPVFQ